METRCIGYRELRGECKEKAGTKWSDIWCEKCDQKRRDNISKNMNKIAEKFQKSDAPRARDQEGG